MLQPAPGVAPLVTCRVELIRPRIGFAVIRALQAAGCTDVVPEGQTGCGPPAIRRRRSRR
jgi:L-lactate dehydrogenase complex protein LldE